MVEMVDNSILSSVAKCSVQALMQYHFGYTTTAGKNMANVGKAIHAGHARYFTDWGGSSALGVCMAEYDKLVVQDEMEAGDPCMRENVAQIVTQYYDTHPAEYFPFEPIVEGIEKVHRMPLMDGVEFFGLIDLPVREKATGALMVCDHKNRFGRITDWWTKDFGLNSQFTGYVATLQSIYDEIVPGVYINVIEVNKLPNDTTTRCRIHKVPYNQCRMQHAKSQLFIVSRTPELIAAWEVQARGLTTKWLALKKTFTDPAMVKHAPLEGTFTGGCKFCDYKKFCRSGREERLIDGMFVVRHWRPWEEEK